MGHREKNNANTASKLGVLFRLQLLFPNYSVTWGLLLVFLSLLRWYHSSTAQMTIIIGIREIIAENHYLPQYWCELSSMEKNGAVPGLNENYSKTRKKRRPLSLSLSRENSGFWKSLCYFHFPKIIKRDRAISDRYSELPIDI